MAKRVMITGASGLLGRAVFKKLSENPSFDVLGLAFSRSDKNLRKVDLTDSSALQKVIQDFKPSAIIHVAAERRPDVVENQPEITKKLNIDATQTLCDEAAKLGAWVVYISTDYVFDGTSPPYKVTDPPNPLNKYGQSKYDGEKVTLDANPENAVLRVPILYGDVEYLGESAVTVLFNKVKETGSACTMSDYERRFPTACQDIAVILEQLMEKKAQNEAVSGIFHWSGDENMTKYNMAVTMAEVSGLSTNHIVADKSPVSGPPRPYNAQLDCSRLEQLGCSQRTKFRDEIHRVLKHYM